MLDRKLLTDSMLDSLSAKTLQRLLPEVTVLSQTFSAAGICE